MTVNELIEALQEISAAGKGGYSVDVRNPAGDYSDLNELFVGDNTRVVRVGP